MLVHQYTLDGSKIIRETVTNNGTASYDLYYLYDKSGSVTGFIYNNTYYYFQKNLQGDVIRILDSLGAVVTEYTYDAWGNVLTVTGSLASTVGRYNPFRYRGYYYDEETGFYYLQSRYYDPVVGRFLNADGIIGANGGVLGYNMFAYCSNNPVCKIDTTGYSWFNNIIDDVLSVVKKVLDFLGVPWTDVGAAQPYVEMQGSEDETSPNCYAYAIGSSENEQPGKKSGRIPTQYYDVNDVGASVEADLKAMGYTVRKVCGPDSLVYENEFKIALRVGTRPFAIDYGTGKLLFDYHFMRQTDTGQWAEKHGCAGDSILWDEGMTPDTIPWSLGNITNYYDSPIIYYAVGN